MIECTDLFDDAEWAGARIVDKDVVLINYQKHQAITTIRIRIDKVASFLDVCRKVQEGLQQKTS